jgi:hypothetical protein
MNELSPTHVSTSYGAFVRIAGTAIDAARRGRSGTWRYIIDNPFGTAA